MASLSLILCVGIATATMVLFLLDEIERRRLKKYTLDDALRTMEEIRRDFDDLPNLQGKERQAKCKSIAKGMLLNVQFIIQFTFQFRQEDGEENPEIAKLRREVMKDARRLHAALRKLLFLLRFRPESVKDCHRTRAAKIGHLRMWIAFLRFMKAKYPDECATLVIPTAAPEWVEM